MGSAPTHVCQTALDVEAAVDRDAWQFVRVTPTSASIDVQEKSVAGESGRIRQLV